MDFSDAERRRGIYIIGKTGTGKTTHAMNLALKDINEGRGIFFIDPHGPDSLTLLDAIPDHRVNDVIYMNLADTEYSVGLTLPILPQTLLDTALGIWQEALTDRAAWFFLNGLYVLKDNPQYNITHLKRLYYDPVFRERLLINTTNKQVREFWENEYHSYSKNYVTDAPGTLHNKIGQMLLQPQCYAALSQKHPQLDIKTAIEKKRIVVVNLSKGRIGKGPASLLGSFIISQIYAVLFNSNGEYECNLFVDEFQSFGSSIFADMLSELRKYGLKMTLMQQFMGQLHKYPEVQDALLGNVGTMFLFQVGPNDAATLAKFIDSDSAHIPEHTRVSRLLNQLPHHCIIVRSGAEPLFHFKTDPPPASKGNAQKIMKESKHNHAHKIPPPSKPLTRHKSKVKIKSSKTEDHDARRI